MSVTSDSSTRDRIVQELDTNFVVEAAAGTGKTTSLVNRMVALIETGRCSIEQFAAVTFTRKAAAELRDRFQAAVRKRATERTLSADAAERLKTASDHINLAFVGTIHSFCASLLRERPIEFGVDPAFRELDEKEDQLLREQAWQENISDLLASKNPLIDQLQDFRINRIDLKDCYEHFIEYRDITNWPVSVPEGFDTETLKAVTQQYIDHMKTLVDDFPAEKGNDKQMLRYELIVRASERAFQSDGRFFSLLQQFDKKQSTVLKCWPSKDLAKEERERWEAFRTEHVERAMVYWTRYRYQFVIDFLQRAVDVYRRLKQINGGLDFQDLLLTVAEGLKRHSHLRSYFQSRYLHLLVDEFQDTDPLQAQMMLYLTGTNTDEEDWTKCVPKAGALFLVGDPKQSIYRFRRGDIITYNRVKEVVCEHGGEVLPLVKNFRSVNPLIDWNNRVFRDRFRDQATQYSPAAEDMVVGRDKLILPAADAPTMSGVYHLNVSLDLTTGEARQQEANRIAAFIRRAIDAELQVARKDDDEINDKLSDSERGELCRVQPRDFLIVPWGKRGMSVYTDALERNRIPYQVSGGNSMANHGPLAVLLDCLRAIDDPTNPVHFLAVLREHFGFSDQELFAFREAGGRFNYNAPVPKSLDTLLRKRFREVCVRFQSYQAAIRNQPYAAAVTMIARELGIVAASAASEEGNLQAGALFKVIEWLRSQSWDFDSTTDLIQFLEEVLTSDDSDACPALPQDDNVVRIMNLHKAKGLEAPIVFLADTANRFSGEVRCHVDRRASEPAGYMGITAKVGEWKKETVAAPADWSSLQKEEQKFLDAEHDRLLYVAATRAACATVVSVGKDKSNWADLHPYLQQTETLPALTSVRRTKAVKPSTPAAAPKSPPQKVTQQLFAFDEPEQDTETETETEAEVVAPQYVDRWGQLLEPSYSIVTAKKLGLQGVSRPDWQASGDYGHEWGSAVHELLEVCHKHPDSDLQPTALRLAGEYHLGSDRLPELLATVEAVVASEIWKRAQASNCCYSELPFETTQLDRKGRPELVRGVIDLIFEEPAGWVIVDYKTDDIQPGQVASAVKYYGPQLQTYARYWQELTGNTVSENALFFTKLNECHTC